MSTAAQVAADLVSLAVAARGRVHGVVVTFTGLLETGVKRNASLPRSGPPGPRLITGNYVRSINRRVTKTPVASEGQVGTNAPQGPRLEMGFEGLDSLGREYHQPPYPHFGPALDEIDGPFTAAVQAAGLPTDRRGR